MVVLKILSGRMAGSEVLARHFPFRIGRETDAHLTLSEAGVWEQHAVLSLDPSGHFQLQCHDQAGLIVNGQRLPSATLRNGDLVELGSVKMGFNLSPTRHHSLVIRESLTWTALLLLCGLQITLIYWLAR